MSILAVENFLIEETKTVMGQHVREVDSLAAEFDTSTLKRLVKNPPAVYWAFLGGSAKKDYDAWLDGRWVMYIVTSHANGNKAQRQGDKREIGAYQMLEMLIPFFGGLPVPDVGEMRFRQVQNLFSERFEKQGVAVYAASFSLPMEFILTVDDSLDDFVTFNADYDIEQHEGAVEHNKWLQEPADHSTSMPDAEQKINLEQ